MPDREAPTDELALERQRHSETLWDVARVLQELKQPQKAESALAARIELWKKRPPEELLNLAIKHLTDGSTIGYGKVALSGRAGAVRELDRKQAASDLKLAIEHGLKDKDLTRLRSLPEASAFLSRDDVKATIKGVDAPGAAQDVPRIEKSEGP